MIEKISNQIFEEGGKDEGSMSLEDFSKWSSEEKKALATFFAQYGDQMKKFFVPFEEEQLLIDSQKFEKKNSSSLGDVLVIAGPAGVGKDTAIKKLLEAHPEVAKVVSATTRAPRPGEKDKIDYHFLDRETFLMLLEARMLIHRAEYASQMYGVPKAELKKRINSKAIIFGVVGEGIAVLKKMIPETKTIVIMPANIEEQIERLRRRGTESDAQILQRVEEDKILFANYKDMFDYVVISEDGEGDSVVSELSEIIKK